MVRFAIALLLVCLFAPAPAARAADKPNILFIFSDDHALRSISAYGDALNQTPHIDRIAREGAIFRNTFCGNSICGPSRAAILTGLHSHANGFRENGDKFDGSQPTLPKYLKPAGYQSAIIGKWHLVTQPTGFDHWDILPGQGRYYQPVFESASGRRTEQGYATDVVTDLGLKWLEEGRDKSKPFLLMLQHKAPHREWMPGPQELNLYDDVTFPEPPTLFDDYAGRAGPASKQEMEIDRHMRWGSDLFCPLDDKDREMMEARLKPMTPEQRKAWDAAFADENAEFLSKRASMSKEDVVRWKYQRYIKNYLRCVAAVDRNVGRVLDYLDETDLAENTIVFYSSDQGFYLGEHGWYDKRWAYEESMRMPLVARWPGKIKPGTEVTALTQNIDFAPTMLAMAGVEAPEAMHGTSMLPLLTGDASGKDAGWRDAVYYHYYESNREHNVAKHVAVRDGRHKLIYYYETKEWELFDLEKDPQEMRSVYAEEAYAQQRAALTKKLAELIKQYDDKTAPEIPANARS